jgi:hypothetical protein
VLARRDEPRDALYAIAIAESCAQVLGGRMARVIEDLHGVPPGSARVLKAADRPDRASVPGTARPAPAPAALFETALEAGVRSAHDRKIQLLARVVAQVANDTATVDDAELVASTIRERRRGRAGAG